MAKERDQLMTTKLKLQQSCHKSKPCQYCHKTFTPKMAIQKFCNAVCSARGSALHDSQKRPKRVYPLVPCRQCQTPFPQVAKNNYYCSSTCNKLYAKQKKASKKKNALDTPASKTKYNLLKTTLP